MVPDQTRFDQASALLIDPSIKPKIRIVYHARSEWSWPQRSEQFKVG